jgi:hypothetical protein
MGCDAYGKLANVRAVTARAGGDMKGVDDSASHGHSEKPAWRAPKLQALGNLRNFVQNGNKSGPFLDSPNDPNPEMMLTMS